MIKSDFNIFLKTRSYRLIVNNKLSVSSKIIAEIENSIYFCLKFGVRSHMKKIDCNRGFYMEHLFGLAYFVKMVDKDKGEKYH